MNFWWVNQNQTYKYEINEGYLWCPKRTKAGHKLAFYDYMTQVQPGDIVFSFVQQQIRAIGIIQEYCISRDRPVEFKEIWENDGWYVSVAFKEISKAKRITPKLHFDELRSFLNYTHPPLSNTTGKGREFYLTTVTKELAYKLAELMKVDFNIILDELYDPELLANKEEQKIQSDSILSDTEKDSLIKSRRGQGIFKKNVKQIYPRCYLTGITSTEFLRASHVKPWAKSTNQERLDGNNGLLLVPHLDHLFDYGYISFKENGELLLSPLIPEEIQKQYNLTAFKGAFSLNQEQEKYMDYHRTYRFKKGNLLTS